MPPADFDESLEVGAGMSWGAGEETQYLLRDLRSGSHIERNRDVVPHHPVKTGLFDHAARERQWLSVVSRLRGSRPSLS
jgi:hypothetical protein